MALEQLIISEPLGEILDRMTGFVEVRRYRKLRLCGFSDVLTDVHIEWSRDGVQKHIASAVKIGSQLWRSEELAVLMPYLRLHVINNSGRPNHALDISVHAFGQDQAPNQDPVVPIARVESFEIKAEPVEPPPEVPKKRVWFGKAKSQSPKQTFRDDRLPGFLPHNSLLVTDKKGAIMPLAPGNVGDVLMMACDGPRWISRQEQQDTAAVISVSELE